MGEMTATVDAEGNLVMSAPAREMAGLAPGASFKVVVTARRIELEPIGARPEEPRGALQIEAEIGQLYGEIRDLVTQAADPDVRAEIQHKRERIQALKAEEAAVLRRRAESMSRLRPGEGDALLEHAEELLSR